MKRSVYNNTTARVSLLPVARTATANGTAVRLAGSDAYRSAMVVVQTGAITDGTHTIELQDSDDNSSFTAVADIYLQGSEPAIGAANDNVTYYIGYTGTRNYLRVVSTVAGATAGGLYCAIVILGEASHLPVSHTA